MAVNKVPVLKRCRSLGLEPSYLGSVSYTHLDVYKRQALPRVRDFRGVNPNAFDGRGNYALGIKEQIIFPEIE